MLARGLGIGGLVVGAVGLAFGLTSRRDEGERLMRTVAASAIAAIIVAVAVAGPVGFVTPAYAHNVLVASTPAAGEVLTELPAAVQRHDERGAARARRAATGSRCRSRMRRAPTTATAASRSSTPRCRPTPRSARAGEYTMLWQAVSADGHSVDGDGPVHLGARPATWSRARARRRLRCAAQAVTPTPSASASPAPATGEPTAAPEAASGIDLATVLWIGGALLAVGIAVAVAIAVAGRRKPTP